MKRRLIVMLCGVVVIALAVALMRLSMRAPASTREALATVNSEGGLVAVRLLAFVSDAPDSQPVPGIHMPGDPPPGYWSKRPLSLYLIPGDVTPTDWGRGKAVAYHFSPAQASKLLDHLAENGFFDRAVKGPAEPPRSTSRTYWLKVGALKQGYGSPMPEKSYTEDLGWGPGGLAKLKGIRGVLEGDAAESMDSVLARLEALERQESTE